MDVSKHGPDEVLPKLECACVAHLLTVQPHEGAKESLGNCCSFAGFTRGGCELSHDEWNGSRLQPLLGVVCKDEWPLHVLK